MKTSLVLGLLAAMLQCGCLSTIALVNAADSAVPRTSKPDSGVYSFSFTYEDQPPISVAFRCEEYYDTQASTRGNFWAWREEGAADRSVAREIVIEDKRYGRISFKLPTCAELKDPQWSNAPLSSVVVNGKYYIHLRSDGGEHVYRHGTNASESQTITLRFVFRMFYLPAEKAQPVVTAQRPPSGASAMPRFRFHD